MLSRIQNTIEQFIDWTGRTIAWLTLIMVLVTFLVVFMRYVFDSGSIAMQESVSFMHALVFLVGAAYTLKHNEHVRVDIFYNKLSPIGKAWIDLLGSLLILMPVLVFITWSSWGYVTDSWRIYESSGETGGLPGIFLLKSSILVMAGLLVLQGLAEILKALLVLQKRVNN